LKLRLCLNNLSTHIYQYTVSGFKRLGHILNEPHEWHDRWKPIFFPFAYAAAEIYATYNKKKKKTITIYF